MPVPDCFLFAGPTLRGIAPPDTLPVTCLPPAMRGDVTALVSRELPGHMAIVDGLFYQSLAIGHAELRAAMEAGWSVWGLSSMGAIRACEMRGLGMRGYGQVYRCFVEDEHFRDDEVTLLHGPGPDYRPLSEPLIHLRMALDALAAAGAIDPTAAAAVQETLAGLWFGDRTLGRVRHELRLRCPELSAAHLDHWLATIDRHRVKSQDLDAFLQERPWRHP